jgi:hypothetical protein
MEIQGNGWRVTLAVCWPNKRFNWIYRLQLPIAQLDFSFLEFRNADRSGRRRDHLCF